MTRTTRIGMIIVLLALLFIPLIIFAAEFRTGDQPSLSAGETLANDLYMVGGNVTASGSVRGDLIAAGGSLIVSGPVSADLIAAGGNVTILGDVGDDVRALGGNVVVQGKVTDDVIIGAGQVNLGGSGIGGDVAIGGGMVRIDTPVKGSVRIGGGEVYINAAIGGDVNVEADKVTLGPKTVIGGDFTYSAAKTATLEEGAIVRGETTFTERKSVGGISKAGVAGLLSLWFISKFFMTLAGALGVVLIFRRYAETLVKTAAAKPLLETGRGLIFFVVTPVTSIILLVTLIGVPLGLLGLIAFAGALVFVSITAPIVVGSVVHRFLFKPVDYQISWKTVLLGVILYSLFALIPFIGWIIKFGVVLLTLGATVNVKWGLLKEWR